MSRVILKYGVVMSFVLLLGCLPSLHPLYTNDTIVFDEALLGKWYDDSGDNWTFTQNGDKGYNVRVLEDGEERFFEVYLVQLEGYRFIDLFPGDNFELENTPDMYKCNLVPAHTFMKLELTDPNLQLQWVNFFDLIEWSPETLKHERIHGKGNSIVITAKPEEIQRVLIENLEKSLEEELGMLQKCPVDFSEVNSLFDMELLGVWESGDNEYLNIITADNGYDILYRNDETLQTLKGILYNLNKQSVLGLYLTSKMSKKFHEHLNLPPDILVQIECDKQQLKIRYIKWGEVQDFMADNSKYSFENSEPDDVFQRVAD